MTDRDRYTERGREKQREEERERETEREWNDREFLVNQFWKWEQNAGCKKVTDTNRKIL